MAFIGIKVYLLLSKRKKNNVWHQIKVSKNGPKKEEITHNEEKNQWIETNSDMKEIIELEKNYINA